MTQPGHQAWPQHSEKAALSIHELMVEIFGLVLPVKVSKAVVEKDDKLIYDPATKDESRGNGRKNYDIRG
jgi:hypothetical protein